MLDNVTEVTVDNLLNVVAARLPLGYRFVTMTCSDLGPAFDVMYHFDRDYRLETLRLTLPKGMPLPSISVIYFAAALIENELQDLFGLKVSGLAIDYEGRFLLAAEAPKAPLCRPAEAAAAKEKPPRRDKEKVAP